MSEAPLLVMAILAIVIGLLLFLAAKFGMGIAKLLLPTLVGALLAFLAMFGLIWSQTQPPDTNPANQPILTYGT